MALNLPYRNVWPIKSNRANYPFEVLCRFYWPARNAEHHAVQRTLMCTRMRALFDPDSCRLSSLWGKGVNALQEEMRRGETDDRFKREGSGGDSPGLGKV